MGVLVAANLDQNLRLASARVSRIRAHDEDAARDVCAVLPEEVDNLAASGVGVGRGDRVGLGVHHGASLA